MAKFTHKKFSRDEFNSVIGIAVELIINRLEVKDPEDVLYDLLCDRLEEELEPVLDVPDYNYN